jgi:hypothetical protein
LPRGEFEIGVWNSLSTVCDRLDKNWSDVDERGALENDSVYKDLATAIAEAEQTRVSMCKDLLDGPMRAMQQHAEYRVARQAIYEKVHELDRRLEAVAGDARFDAAKRPFADCGRLTREHAI